MTGRLCFACLLSSVLTTGCIVGPNYQPPDPAAPAAWREHQASQAELIRTEHQLHDWWSSFNDPILDELVASAIAGNLDLKRSGQLLLSARAVRDQIAAGLSPQIDADGELGITRSSTTLQFPPLANVDSDSRLWSPGFTASWELDLFGRIHRQLEAQTDTVQADIEGQRGLLVEILGELTRDYVELRAAQGELQVARSNIRAAGQNLDLSNKVFAQGLGTSLQVAQAQAELDTARASTQPLQTRVAQLSHAIGTLLGLQPGSLETMLQRPAPIPKPPALPVLLPTLVIANRPDIRQAERQYAAATARIGVAVASLYPDFSLPLSLGLQSSMLHELLAADSLAFQLVLSAAQPLYHGGRISAQIRQARAEAEASRLAYQATVLTAFQEIEDQLVAYSNDTARSRLLHRAANDNQLALDRARRLYAAGLSGFLDVLTAERATYQSQDTALLGDLTRLQDAVSLYTALGAGWQTQGRGAALDPLGPQSSEP